MLFATIFLFKKVNGDSTSIILGIKSDANFD